MTSRRAFLVGLIGLGGLAASGCKLTPARPVEAGDLNAPAGEAKPTGRILFVTSNGQLWRWRDGDTGVLSSDARFADPAWSPDGDRIAVVQMGTNHSDVFVHEAQGMRGTQITRHWSAVSVQQSAWGRKPAWSPDGTRVVYVSDFGGYQVNDMSLWVADVPGGNPRQVLRMPAFSGGVDWPSWSPDGEEIAYTGFPSRVSQIQVLTLATGAIRTLTEFEAGAYDPAWSPDGQRLAFVFRESRRHVIAMLDADGTNLVRLAELDQARAPAWSPDGTHLAYIGRGDAGFDLYAIRLPTTPDQTASAPKQLTKNLNVEAQSGISWTT